MAASQAPLPGRFWAPPDTLAFALWDCFLLTHEIKTIVLIALLAAQRLRSPAGAAYKDFAPRKTEMAAPVRCNALLAGFHGLGHVAV